jgi:predicted hotdog family 3-hydroxylacyl-ACP dehydratase
MVDLLPHRPPMILLDRLEAFDDDSAIAVAVMRPDHLFARGPGVPAHVGIEMMAQACGAHVGALARSTGGEVQLGFLLGTRAYAATSPYFPLGAELRITVRRVFCEDGMGVYDCRIVLEGEEIAQAQLNLYQPPDVATAVARLRGDNG